MELEYYHPPQPTQTAQPQHSVDVRMGWLTNPCMNEQIKGTVLCVMEKSIAMLGIYQMQVKTKQSETTKLMWRTYARANTLNTMYAGFVMQCHLPPHPPVAEH